jgi:hypothetical protein
MAKVHGYDNRNVQDTKILRTIKTQRKVSVKLCNYSMALYALMALKIQGEPIQ